MLLASSLPHSVHLETPDSVLQERHVGKRVDPLTGGVGLCHIPSPLVYTATHSHTTHSHFSCADVYHTTFALPSSSEVASRLVEDKGGPALLKQRLRDYRR